MRGLPRGFLQLHTHQFTNFPRLPVPIKKPLDPPTCLPKPGHDPVPTPALQHLWLRHLNSAPRALPSFLPPHLPAPRASPSVFCPLQDWFSSSLLPNTWFTPAKGPSYGPSQLICLDTGRYWELSGEGLAMFLS